MNTDMQQTNANRTVRHSHEDDLPAIFAIYEIARQAMIDNGNPTQWGDFWPPEDMVVDDVANGISFVLEGPEGIEGVFAPVFGTDPTYEVIENGAWLNDEPYVTIHRLASNGTAHGIFAEALDYCLQHCDNVRIDTHADNSIMRHLIEKVGFVYCGIIYHTDGTPRVAYQLVKGA